MGWYKGCGGKGEKERGWVESRCVWAVDVVLIFS